MDKVIYVVDQRALYSHIVPKYAFYNSARDASLHNSLAAVKPTETSRKLPDGIQGQEYVIYDRYDK